jgi:hypothetical protein
VAERALIEGPTRLLNPRAVSRRGLITAAKPGHPYGRVVYGAALDAAVTVTRASAESYLDENGVLQSAANNVAAWAGGARLQVYEGRTNMLLWSGDISNAAWTKTRSAAVGQGAGTGFDGVGQAWKLRADSTAANTHYLRVSPSVTSGTIYTAWCVAKSAELTAFSWTWTSAFGAAHTVTFNLATGAATTTAGTAVGAMKSLGQGRWLCSMVATAGATASPFLDMNLLSGGNSTFDGDGASGILLYHLQLEAGYCVTPAIPTTTATVTRAVDAISLPSAPLFPDNAGTVLFKGVIPQVAGVAASQALVVVDNGTTNNRWGLWNPNNGVNIAILRVIGGVAIVGSAAGSYNPGTSFRAGLAFDAAGRCSLSFNGGALQVMTDGPAGSLLTTFRIGNSSDNNRPLNGEVETLLTLPFAAHDDDLPGLVLAL